MQLFHSHTLFSYESESIDYAHKCLFMETFCKIALCNQPLQHKLGVIRTLHHSTNTLIIKEEDKTMEKDGTNGGHHMDLNNVDGIQTFDQEVNWHRRGIKEAIHISIIGSKIN